VRSLDKYLGVHRLRTREPFLSYIKKWVLISTGLGLLTGVVAALFDYVTNLALWNYSSTLITRDPLLIIPFLFVGLLLSGFLLSRSSRPVASGTEEVVEVYNNPAARLDERSFPLKMLAAIATIGLGGSAGMEGPSVYAGGVVGSWVWRKLRRFRLNDVDRRTLILAGAAAGIGAIFKAPLTGTVFALEVPYKDDLAHDALVPSLVASVTSYVTLIVIDGPEPIFKFPAILTLSLVDVAASALLGLLVGVAALVFILTSNIVAAQLRRFGAKFYYKATIGAGVLSIIGIISVWLFHSPYPLGISYTLIGLSLTPKTFTGTLLALFAMKLVATSFTLGSTGVGGIFIPQIVMGASLGGLFGEAFFPSRLALFVAVGMASFLAAGYKTPLAAVTFVAETAGGPAYLIPSLVAAAVSYSISGEASVSTHQKLSDEVDRKRLTYPAGDVLHSAS